MEVEILILITAELRDNNSKLQDNKQKNDNEPSRFGVAQAVGGVSVQAHAKAAFLRRFSRLFLVTS